MTSIEQAREALACPHCGGDAEVLDDAASVDFIGEVRYSVHCQNLTCRAGQYGWDTPDRSIAAWNRRASPTTPVDGVGAEPRDDDPICTCCGGTGVTYQTERRCACQGPDTALASPEAEARLRERVAELEQIIHQLRTSQPDNFAASQQWKDRAEAAEARLAQAEGGPKVTDLVFHVGQLRHAYTHLKANRVSDQPGLADGLISPAIAALEAALHPQSAAGGGREVTKRVVFTSEASAALCKALRIHTWIDTKSHTSLFGIQARLAPRQWAHVAVNGAPLLFDTETEARRKMDDLLERQP